MGDEPDLDPEISRSFFEGNVLKLDPSLLTENGIRLVKQLIFFCLWEFCPFLGEFYLNSLFLSTGLS